MTVIASYSVEGSPIILGDLLISGYERGDSSLNIPGVGDVSNVFPKGSGFVPTSLCQKIVILDQYCALAWAGKKIIAASIINDLIKIIEDVGPNQSSIGDCLNDYQGEDISVIVVFVDNKDSNLTTVSINVAKYQTKNFGIFQVSGTGDKTLIRMMQHLEQIEIEHSTTPNLFDKVLASSLNVISSLLPMSFYNHESLFNYFGGGYEIAYLSNEGFKKLDNIAYIFWSVIAYGPDDIMLPFDSQVFHYAYQGESLFLNAIRVSTKNSTGFDDIKIVENSVYEILPPHIYRHKSSYNHLPIEPYIVGHYISIFDKQNTSLGVLTLIDKVGNPSVRINRKSDTHISIEWKTDLIDRILRKAKLFYKELCNNM